MSSERAAAGGDAEGAFEVAVAGAGLGGFDPCRRIRWTRVPSPAQEARCPAVGNTLMSAPVSARNTSAMMRGEARDADQQVPGRAKRCHRLLDAGVQARDVCGVGVDAIQMQSDHERVMGAEPAGQRLGQRRDLRPQPPLEPDRPAPPGRAARRSAPRASPGPRRP